MKALFVVCWLAIALFWVWFVPRALAHERWLDQLDASLEQIEKSTPGFGADPPADWPTPNFERPPYRPPGRPVNGLDPYGASATPEPTAAMLILWAAGGVGFLAGRYSRKP